MGLSHNRFFLEKKNSIRTTVNGLYIVDRAGQAQLVNGYNSQVTRVAGL